MSTNVIDTLAEGWRASGVERGDTLLVHSNIKRTLLACRRSGSPVSAEIILDSFLAALGPDGTLLLPLFNFDFTKGVPFDIRNTPSQMGSMTEAGRVRAGTVRTGHPIYSFAALGAQAHRFSAVDNVSAFADDSPFGILRGLDGRIAVLDLEEFDSMTFVHHVEEVKRVAYRYFKDFIGPYVDVEGNTTTRTYRLHVRDVAKGVITTVNPAGELMWAEGLYRGCRPGIETGLRTIKAADVFRFVSRLIDESRALGNLYAIVPPQ